MKNFGVGYGKPPKATQFKPGQSGNPKGRPKGAKNFATEVEEELNERIAVKEGGKTTRISKRRAALKRLFDQGLKGDARALAHVLQLARDQDARKSPETEPADLDGHDDEIIARYLERIIDETGD